MTKMKEKFVKYINISKSLKYVNEAHSKHIYVVTEFSKIVLIYISIYQVLGI